MWVAVFTIWLMGQNPVFQTNPYVFTNPDSCSQYIQEVFKDIDEAVPEELELKMYGRCVLIDKDSITIYG